LVLAPDAPDGFADVPELTCEVTGPTGAVWLAPVNPIDPPVMASRPLPVPPAVTTMVWAPEPTPVSWNSVPNPAAPPLE
jgi:hypothetical protein